MLCSLVEGLVLICSPKVALIESYTNPSNNTDLTLQTSFTSLTANFFSIQPNILFEGTILDFGTASHFLFFAFYEGAVGR